MAKIRVRGGDPERRHETPWARDGWGSGAGQSFQFVLIFFSFLPVLSIFAIQVDRPGTRETIPEAVALL